MTSVAVEKVRVESLRVEPRIRDPRFEGATLARDTLPTFAEIEVWTSQLRWIAVHAVKDGLLTQEEALARFDINQDQLKSWQWADEMGFLLNKTQTAPSK